MGSQWRPLSEELPLPARLLTERLRALKDADALSLADIAAATHYSRASWERWLNGKRLITRAALLGFAEAVGADAAPLLLLLEQAESAPREPGGAPPALTPEPEVEQASLLPAVPAALVPSPSPIKGSAAGYYCRSVLAGLPVLRPLLLEGNLVREGVLDRAGLARMLEPERLIAGQDYRSVAVWASIEAWSRAWA